MSETISRERGAAIVVLVIGVSMIISALWFFDFFVWDHATTAYIPFIAWAETFTDPGTVLQYFYGIIIVGIALLAASAYSLGRLE